MDWLKGIVTGLATGSFAGGFTAAATDSWLAGFGVGMLDNATQGYGRYGYSAFDTGWGNVWNGNTGWNMWNGYPPQANLYANMAHAAANPFDYSAFNYYGGW
jgi:hypothetical protein